MNYFYESSDFSIQYAPRLDRGALFILYTSNISIYFCASKYYGSHSFSGKFCTISDILLAVVFPA